MKISKFEPLTLFMMFNIIYGEYNKPKPCTNTFFSEYNQTTSDFIRIEMINNEKNVSFTVFFKWNSKTVKDYILY
jgi:hypothetical protein